MSEFAGQAPEYPAATGLDPPFELSSFSNSELRVHWDEERGAYRFIGEIDISNAEALWHRMSAHLAGGRRLALDFSELTFMDSQGLRLLLRVAEAACDRGLDPVVVHAPTAAVLRVLEVAVPEGIRGLEIRR